MPRGEAGVGIGTVRNVVICCDGTGNEFVHRPRTRDTNSNVVKLYTALCTNAEQITYYHPGVGTMGDPAASGRVRKRLSVWRGMAFAWGFRDNVLDAYRFLIQNYRDGDRVFLVGFSRGAYTVRALAGLLDGYGLLCPGNEGHMLYAWNNYARQRKTRRKGRIRPDKRFKETFSRKQFRIHFLGVWDTVSSVGWVSTPLRLASVTQNPTVRIARHAISIDERRCFYRNNLLLPADAAQLAGVASDDDPQPSQDLLTVWFAGVHSDIGGSYPQSECGLSNVALSWMLDQAVDAGVKLKPEVRAMVEGKTFALTGDRDTDRKLQALEMLYREPSHAPVHRSLHGLWWLLETFPHRYYDFDDQAERWRTPLGAPRRIPPGSWIHATVASRLKHSHCGYAPPNLLGGAASLEAIDLAGQPHGSLLRYTPGADRKPFWNEAWVRVGVMIGVSFLQVLLLAVLGLLCVWLYGRVAVLVHGLR